MEKAQVADDDMATFVYISHGNKTWLDGDDLFHRTNGPACEYTDGTREWWIHGRLHRTDGPARECGSGEKQWFLDGRELTEKEFRQRQEGQDVEKEADVRAAHEARLKKLDQLVANTRRRGFSP